MKQNNSSGNNGGRQSAGHQHRPEIRDNLDSRSNEEQETKGDDVTNNHKDVHNNSKGARKEKQDRED